MTLRGTLKGHNGWVTQIATTPQDPNQILSASRGKLEKLGSSAGSFSAHRIIITCTFLHVKRVYKSVC